MKNPRVLQIPKIHSNKKALLIAIEVLVVFFLVVGTYLTLLKPAQFSFSTVADSLKSRFSLKGQERAEEPLAQIEQVRRAIDGKVLSIKTIEQASEGYFVLNSKEGITVLIAREKNLNEQVRTLQTALSKAKIERKAVILVDFRFEKLVVRYKS